MSSILRPGYVRWDGTKYVLDPDIEIVGPPGPPGPAGSGGGGSSLIYQPGGTTVDNVFASWTALMAKRATIKGPITIVIDDSITSPAVIDVGIWNLAHNTPIVGVNGNQVEFNGNPLTALLVPDGAQLLDPNSFSDLDITGNSATIPSIETIGADELNFEAWNCIFRNSGFSSIPLIHTSGGVIDLHGSCHLVSSNNSSFIIEGNSGDFTLNVNDQSVVDGYSLKLSPSLVAVVNVSGGGFFSAVQFGISIIAFTLNQQNPIQAAPRNNFDSFNPNLTVIRPEGFNAPVGTGINGAINFGSEDPGFAYQNGAPNTQGTNANFATVLGGTNNDIDTGCVFCVIAGGSGNIFNNVGGAPTWGYISGRDNKIIGPGSFSAIVGGEDNTIDTSNTCFILGRNCNINNGSNNCAIVGGDSNGISGNASRSIVAGGVQNFILGGQGNGVFAGQNNSAGATGLVGAVVLGGDLNTATNESCAVIAGEQNSVTSQFGIVVGGNQNTVSGDRAVIIGGQGNIAPFESSVVMGISGRTHLPVQFSHGSGGGGGGQFCRYIVSGTAAGTTTLALLDAGNSNLLLENGKAYAIKATCIANRVGVAGRAMFIHTLLAHQTSGGAFIDSDNITLSVPNGQTWTIAFDINGGPGVSNSLRALFTATAGHTVNVMVTYEWSEVGGGV